jgi:hypothetical protein
MQRSTVWAGYVWTFNFAGIDCTQGLGKGGFLEITQEEESVTTVVGLDGEVAFNQKPQGVTRIKATYLQTSKTNALLSAYYNASQAADGLPGPLAYEDRKGTSKMVGVAAMLTKLPDEKVGAEADDVTWEFIVGPNVRFVGSH